LGNLYGGKVVSKIQSQAAYVVGEIYYHCLKVGTETHIDTAEVPRNTWALDPK
jgi:hypothetical protein